MSKTWGAWRYYAPGYLSADDTEIGEEVISQVLSAVGFGSVDEFNSSVGAHARGELPEELQVKLKAIFQEPAYSGEDVPDQLTVSDGVVTSLEEPLVLRSPFRLADGHEPLEIGIYAMSIEDDGGTYSINLRAGVSSAKLFEAGSKELEGVCSVLIDKLAFGNSDDIDDQDRELLKAYLDSNGANIDLAVDEDFIEELGMQVRYMVESIGISTIPFTDEEGEEIEFWIEAEEEIGFS